MTAAANHQVGCHSLHGSQNVESFNTAPTALGSAIATECHQNGGLSMPLRNLRRHNANDALMPALISKNNGSRVRDRRIRIDASTCLFKVLAVHLPTLFVQISQRLHDGARTRWIISDQKFNRFLGMPQSADRIQTWPKSEANIGCIHTTTLLEFRIVKKRTQTSHFH